MGRWVSYAPSWRRLTWEWAAWRRDFIKINYSRMKGFKGLKGSSPPGFHFLRCSFPKYELSWKRRMSGISVRERFCSQLNFSRILPRPCQWSQRKLRQGQRKVSSHQYRYLNKSCSNSFRCRVAVPWSLQENRKSRGSLIRRCGRIT